MFLFHVSVFLKITLVNKCKDYVVSPFQTAYKEMAFAESFGIHGLVLEFVFKDKLWHYKFTKNKKLSGFYFYCILFSDTVLLCSAGSCLPSTSHRHAPSHQT